MDSKDIFEKVIELTIRERYPDIHLKTGNHPYIRRNNGEIEELKKIEVVSNEYINDKGEKITETEKYSIPVLSKENIEDIIKIIAGEEGFKKFLDNFELDTSYRYEDSDKYRVNCYIDTTGYSVALRIIPSKIPTIEDLGLPDSIKEMCQRDKGLILVTGPTGSGKSTNLAAMIDYINKNFKKHIITVEDPVEFVFKNQKSLINQREIGNHTMGFNQAIRAALREDPDVIMVGEMRDLETIKAAITLAETGHLVLSTLHTNDTVQSIDRIVDVFPNGQQEQIRIQLAMNLVGVISQRLLPKADDSGRIPAREVLIANDAVRNLIITAKTHQLYSVIEVSAKYGMILMDKYLVLLFKKGIIDKYTLFSYVRDKEGVEMLIKD